VRNQSNCKSVTRMEGKKKRERGPRGGGGELNLFISLKGKGGGERRKSQGAFGKRGGGKDFHITC